MTGAQQGHLAMVLFSALVAGSFSLGTRMANDIDPVALTAVRFWLAAGILGAVILVRRQFRRDAVKSLWRYVFLGGLFASYFVLMFEGLKTAPPVSAAAVFTLTPILSAGFGWLIMGQKLSGSMALALVLGGIGALWVIFKGDLAAVSRFDLGPGELIYFLGCVAHALYTPMVAKLNRGETALIFTFGTLLAGGLLLSGYGGQDLVRTEWATLPNRVWITLGYLVVFATAMSFLLLQFAVLRLPAANVMAYTYLVPAWVVLWEVGLGESVPGVSLWVGLSLTVAALIILLKNNSLKSKGNG